MHQLSRRQFLASTTTGRMSGAVPSPLDSGGTAPATILAEVGDAVGHELEHKSHAENLRAPRPPDCRHIATITEAPGNFWMLVGAVRGARFVLNTREDERVEIPFSDRTMRADPVHPYDLCPQEDAIDCVEFSAAPRDTVLITLSGSVTVDFDTTEPGVWAPLHRQPHLQAAAR